MEYYPTLIPNSGLSVNQLEISIDHYFPLYFFSSLITYSKFTHFTQMWILYFKETKNLLYVWKYVSTKMNIFFDRKQIKITMRYQKTCSRTFKISQTLKKFENMQTNAFCHYIFLCLKKYFESNIFHKNMLFMMTCNGIIF